MSYTRVPRSVGLGQNGALQREVRQPRGLPSWSVENLFDRVGGQAFFDALVDRFYAGVETDPVLRPLYPDDLTDPKAHLALFLAQYWGGPPTYNEQRGHPRLRMRHAPFAIDPRARNRWIELMDAALEEVRLPPEADALLRRFFADTATFMINRE